MKIWIHQTYMKIRSIVSAQYGCSLTSGASYITGSYSGKGIYKINTKIQNGRFFFKLPKFYVYEHKKKTIMLVKYI